MRAVDGGHEISRWTWVVGAVISMIIGFGWLLALARVDPSKRADIWWFYVTIIVAFLVGEVVSIVYDAISAKLNIETIIPLKFIFYWLGIIIGAVGGLELLGFVANAFNTVSLVAVVTFVVLTFLPTFLLFLDFVHHERLHGRHRRHALV